MPTAFVNGILRRRKIGIDKCAYRNHHETFLAFGGVKHVAPTNRAKPEAEFCTLIAGTHVFGSGAGDAVRSRVSGEHGKHTAGALLAGKTMANACAQRFALHLDPKLSATTGSCSASHDDSPHHSRYSAFANGTQKTG
jgi:hypothetical protein